MYVTRRNGVMPWVSVGCKISKAAVYKETEVFTWWCWCLTGQFSVATSYVGRLDFDFFVLIRYESSLYIWAKIKIIALVILKSTVEEICGSKKVCNLSLGDENSFDR